MQKRSNKGPHKRARSEPLLWLEVVDILRKETTKQNHKLWLLDTLLGWSEFASAWASIGQPIMSHAYPLEAKYEGVRSIDEMHHWAWAVIDDTGSVDVALEYVNSACPMSSLHILSCFDSMKACHLIYPDGSMHESIMSKISEMATSRTIHTSIVTARKQIEHIRLAAQLTKLVDKHKFRNRIP